MAAGDGDSRSLTREGVQALNSIWQALLALGPVTLGVSTVSGLPTASEAGQGARRMVTDANATTFNSIVAAGGSNVVPIFSDGTNWRIG